MRETKQAGNSATTEDILLEKGFAHAMGCRAVFPPGRLATLREWQVEETENWKSVCGKQHAAGRNKRLKQNARNKASWQQCNHGRHTSGEGFRSCNGVSGSVPSRKTCHPPGVASRRDGKLEECMRKVTCGWKKKKTQVGGKKQINEKVMGIGFFRSTTLKRWPVQNQEEPQHGNPKPEEPSTAGSSKLNGDPKPRRTLNRNPKPGRTLNQREP
jgi:hypothetical protein